VEILIIYFFYRGRIAPIPFLLLIYSFFVVVTTQLTWKPTTPPPQWRGECTTFPFLFVGGHSVIYIYLYLYRARIGSYLVSFICSKTNVVGSLVL
jgi:hypothetical protein